MKKQKPTENKRWYKFYECDCHGEGITISYEYQDENNKFSQVDMGFFKVGFGQPVEFKERLRWAWHLIKTGRPFLDEVILNRNIANELANDLLKWSLATDQEAILFPLILDNKEKRLCGKALHAVLNKKLAVAKECFLGARSVEEAMIGKEVGEEK